jgi:hypothetical protein
LKAGRYGVFGTSAALSSCGNRHLPWPRPFIGFRSLNPNAPQWIWLFQEHLRKPESRLEEELAAATAIWAFGEVRRANSLCASAHGSNASRFAAGDSTSLAWLINAV